MFTALEKAWLLKCIDLQHRALIRSQNAELAGGEIWVLRGKEIATLNALQLKVEQINATPATQSNK